MAAEISAERSIAYVRCAIGISVSIFFFVVPGALALWTTRDREAREDLRENGDPKERNDTTR